LFFPCFSAVATHKYVISFCVGLELITARTPLKLFAVYMCVFSLVSPIGVGIGIGISSAASAGGDTYTFTVAILQALAGGTLVTTTVRLSHTIR
jgi:zinc transporter 1/2/3